MVEPLPGGQKANTKGKGAFYQDVYRLRDGGGTQQVTCLPPSLRNRSSGLEPMCEESTDPHVHPVAPWHTHAHINTHAHNSVKN